MTTLPKALLFDAFGTCVSWRSSIARAGEALGARQALPATDWWALADAWRAHYQPQLDTVRSGRRPWTRLKVLNREALGQVLADFKPEAVPPPSTTPSTWPGGSWHPGPIPCPAPRA